MAYISFETRTLEPMHAVPPSSKMVKSVVIFRFCFWNILIGYLSITIVRVGV